MVWVLQISKTWLFCLARPQASHGSACQSALLSDCCGDSAELFAAGFWQNHCSHYPRGVGKGTGEAGSKRSVLWGGKWQIEFKLFAGPKWAKVRNFLTETKNVIFAVLEVHMQKITLFVGWCMCVFDMCALYVPTVILFTASCMFGHLFTTVIIYVNSFWVQLLIILRLVYMNQYSGHSKWNFVGYYVSS